MDGGTGLYTRYLDTKTAGSPVHSEKGSKGAGHWRKRPQAAIEGSLEPQKDSMFQPQ